METLGIGLAGWGAIGRIHLLALGDIPRIYPDSAPDFKVLGICRTSQSRAEEAAAAENIPRAYGDYEEMLADPDIHLIDIVTPNYLHREQVLNALAAGKAVLCEKPLALSGEEAWEIGVAAEASGCPAGMIFNYRFIPAVMKAKELIDAGGLGDIYSFRAEYFHTGYQNPDRPFSWRMDVSQSGGGALADLGVHGADLIRYLLGDIESVQCDLKTYITERPLPGGAGTGRVTVDDAAWTRLTLTGGGEGSLEVSRFAAGALDDLNISAFGSRGAFRFRLMDPDFLWWFDQGETGAGWRRIETVQNYPGAVLPNPRSVTGWTRYHTENIYRFLKAAAGGTPFSPDFNDGAAAQVFLDAAYLSAGTGRRERLYSKAE